MNRVVGFLLALAVASPAGAADLFVDQASGSDASDGLSWATARATVGSALATAAASPEPDVISVAEGRYREQLVVSADTILLGGFPTRGGVRDPSLHPAVLDGQGRIVAPIVHFPPGADRTVLDGFVVTRAFTDAPETQVGGGVLVEDAAPLIRGNVIEDNALCVGSGIALVYTTARATARVTGNRIIGNGAGYRTFRHRCIDGTLTRCAGIYVIGPPGVDLGIVLSDNYVADNESGYKVDVCFEGQGTIEDLIMERNSGGLWLTGGPIRAVNVLATDGAGPGAYLSCGGTYELQNVTLAANRWGIRSIPGDATTVQVESSILSGNATEVEWACAGASPTIASSLIEGGYPGGTNILDADPLFAPGPLGDYYLSHATAGQSATSPAVDAGGRPSADLGLDQRTTATDSTPDAGTVDLGYHPPRVAPLIIERGIAPDALTAHGTVAGLPADDDAGSLSDPSLPVLFYSIPGVRNELGVVKNMTLDAVRLVFLGR
jgi:hypothetical protein